MRVRACSECADVQLVQLRDVFEERLGVRSKFRVVPHLLRPQLKMVGILITQTITMPHATQWQNENDDGM